MRVLIACEMSGIVRDAFLTKGHDAVSCDLLDSLSEGPHYKGDVLDILDDGWDLLIAHPPCTFLATTAARWLYDYRYPNRFEDRDNSVDFVLKLFNSSIPKVCIENPIGSLSTLWRKPDQIIQPFNFGHDASKATCLWLKNLPKLENTETVPVTYVTTKTGKRFSKWYWDTSKYRGKERQIMRSLTFQGIADAMAEQWNFK